MNFKITLLLFFTLLGCFVSNAQLGETFDIEKPDKYKERIIGYEKTYTKKYTLPRKFIQNTISHYNFFFNANEKLKQVIIAAKEQHKDTFDRLLQYFPYSLDVTKNQKQDLDSVIQKASGGILIHDLRTNWVDNFYLLIGKSYLLQQKYDSAEMTFNYINYEYAPKTKDKDRILTGSKDNNENNSFSISTKEKKSITSKVFERPPSRNESFLWMLRTNIENEDFGSASGLAQTLKNDPIFPKRLHNDLDELTGYLYYKQEVYDSAAHYLSKSLNMADNKNDKARREFLAGQLYELANQPAAASASYASSVKHTLDPVMEVYARLNSIKLRKGSDPKIIDENIAALLKMDKKDAYADYRDIIFYFAGKMEQERNNTEGAINNFVKSTKFATTNLSQKNKSFLELANIAYKDRKYRFAANYYDSLNLSDGSIKNIDEISFRKTTLKKLVSYIDIIEVEDSLQNLAKMLPNDRDDYLKKLLRRLRKEQGIKDDAISFGTAQPIGFDNNAPTNLFEPNNGEWYFYNNSIKSRGNAEFKRKWGNRPNVDNWRRAQAVGLSNLNANRNNDPNNLSNPIGNAKKQVNELSIEGLMKNIPITEADLKISNDTILYAMLKMAKLYQYELEDLPLAIETYEEIVKRFPKHPEMAEMVYNMYLAYTKIGDVQRANQAKAILEKNFKDSKLTEKLTTKTGTNEQEATKAYNEIYNLFVEGNFEKAIAQKKLADQKFGNTNNWSPQLLYIEAVYYIKQRQDSAASASLFYIISLYPTSPLAAKAEKLKNVLSRRAAIEKEVGSLNVTRVEDDPIIIDDTKPSAPPVTITTPVNPPTNPIPTPTNPVVTTPKPKDTIANTPKPPVVAKYPYKTENNKEHYVAVWLNKVDNIFTNEARNAFIIFNRSYGKTLRIDNTPVDAENKILLIQSFSNAQEAINYTTNVQLKAATEIVPWLAKEKYTIVIITVENLALLMANKDINSYKNYLIETFPGKF